MIDKKLKFISFLVVAFFLFLASCSGLLDDDSHKSLEFEKEFYYQYDDTLEVFRSLNFFALYLNESQDMSISRLNDFIEKYNLQPVSRYSHQPYSFLYENQLDPYFPIIFKIQNNKNIEEYYSTEKIENNSFENHPYVKYSVPVYSFDKKGWFYIDNEISIKPLDGETTPDSILNKYHLEYLSEITSVSIFKYTITNFSQGHSISIAKKVYEDGNFLFVSPNRYQNLFNLHSN